MPIWMGGSWNLVSEFKCLEFILDESDTDGTEYYTKVVNDRTVAGAVRSFVNARNLQLQCVAVLHEDLLVPILIYENETLAWRDG